MTWLGSNWRCASGELDLIMQHGAEIVFVEVKVRRGESRGAAEEAVGRAKAEKLLVTADWYIGEHFPNDAPPWRIDLFAITLDNTGQIVRRTHIENAIQTG